MTTIRPNSGMVSQNENRKKEIQLQLRQAMATLRMLPLDARDRPKQASSAWGEFQQIATISVGGLRQPIKRKATPQEISHMNAWLDALAGLPEGQRRIVVARACSIPWRRLEEIDGRSHTTLRKIEGHGLEMLLKTTIGGTPIKGLEN